MTQPALEPKHDPPIQPIEREHGGPPRFRANSLVRYLLDAGPFTLNDLAIIPASRQDQEQFAMLIGYSLDGFGELDYVSDETYEAAARKAVRIP